MTVTQAIQKLRDDIISWCTLNFKRKADASTVANMKTKLDTLSVHPVHTAFTNSTGLPVSVTVDNKGHVTSATTVAFPTIQNQCASQNIVLSSKQYGTSFPASPVNGQLFFKKLDE
jgi:hypothetical protein